jgi:hypothetical protein
MFQTFYGLGLFLVGLSLAVFGEPLAKISNAMNKRILGIELPLNFVRASTTVVGAACSLYGLLVLLRLVIIK